MRRHVHRLRSGGAMLLHGVNGRAIRQHLGNSHHNHMRRHHHGGSLIEPVAMMTNSAPRAKGISNSVSKKITPLAFRI